MPPAVAAAFSHRPCLAQAAEAAPTSGRTPAGKDGMGVPSVCPRTSPWPRWAADGRRPAVNIGHSRYIDLQMSGGLVGLARTAGGTEEVPCSEEVRFRSSRPCAGATRRAGAVNGHVDVPGGGHQEVPP